MPVFQFHLEHGVGQGFDNLAVEFEYFFLLVLGLDWSASTRVATSNRLGLSSRHY